MAQKSIFWTTGSGGDGAAAYTQAEIIRWQRQQWMRDNTTEGVHKHYAQDLKVTAPGSASPYNVATGAGVVYGFPYWNTTNYTASIPTPATGTRYDRIVLQADWSNTAVRIARLGGVAGGTQASLTQTDGVTWEIPLARLEVSTGGVVSVSDKRSFLHPNAEIQLDRIRSLAARSIIGRSANSTGAAAEIVAGTDNRIFARVSNTLGFTTVNSAMIGSGSIIAAHIVNGAVGSAAIGANAISSDAYIDASITAAHVAANSIDDTKVGNRVPMFTRRQGGDASNWDLAGTSDYTPTAVKMQAGQLSLTASGTSWTTDTITFPQAFSDRPLVFVTHRTSTVRLEVASRSTLADTTALDAYTCDGSTGSWTVRVNWLAIGPE